MSGQTDGATSARRRRERRLRSWWRHEYQSVAVALSAAVHLSFDRVATEAKYSGLRAQNTDRAEAALNAPRRQTSGAAREPELFQLFEEELSGARPTTLVEVLPQERVLRHTMEPADAFSTLLCRRWWTSCLMRSHPWTARWPSRLSQCSRSLDHPALFLHPAADC